MSVSLLPRDVDWCDFETFFLLLQDVDVYGNIILMFEFWYTLEKRFLRNLVYFYVFGNLTVDRDFFRSDVARKVRPI